MLPAVILRVGSCSFECIVILLNFFLKLPESICNKEKKISFIKKYLIISIRLVFFDGFLNYSFQTISNTIFIFTPKIDNKADFMLHCILE